MKKNVDVDWSDTRVICLAPEYKKYDPNAVQVMGANIELWQYKTYENGILNIEEVYKRTATVATSNQETNDFNGKNPVMVEAGRKASMTRKTATYTLEEHFEGLNEYMRELFQTIREYITGFDSAIEEAPKKNM